MSKPIIFTVPCGSNTVVKNDFLMQDGAGAIKKMVDTSSTLVGVACENKDAQNNVSCLKLGIAKFHLVSNTSINVGDKMEARTSGVTRFAAGQYIGDALETITSPATGDLVTVAINLYRG